MQKKRLGPIILLITLAIIAIFIIGVRFGQHVMVTNQAINYILSIPPTKTPAPTQPPTFLLYRNDTCGVRFLYPNYLTYKKESTEEATIGTDAKNTSIKISCKKSNDIAQAFKNDTIATEEVTFQSEKKVVKVQDNFYILEFKYTNHVVIDAVVEKSIYPTFQSTLLFD